MAVDEPTPFDAMMFALRASSSSPRGDARRNVETEGIFTGALAARRARAARGASRSAARAIDVGSSTQREKLARVCVNWRGND